ncbi:MAG TPA: hypothetical protein P5137_04110 [Candidatus Brocadiia bacterium]|nr:hypothetical protein [Candidatus Brocadiia bacterium]
MLAALISIVATWLLIGPAFLGLGLALRRAAGVPAESPEDLLAAFWVGWAAALGALQWTSLFLPIGWPARLIVLVLGVAGFVFHGRAIAAIAWPRNARRAAFVACLALFALWLANQSTAPIVLYDAGLYHLTQVRWAASFPAVPGLGNLHVRLAYNNASFLYNAFMSAGPWQGLAHHVSNGLLLLAMAARLGLGAWRRLFGREAKPSDLAALILLGPALSQCFRHASSLSPDLPAFALGVLVCLELIRLALDNLPPGAKRAAAFHVLVLASAGLAVKLTFAVFGFTAAVAALALLWRARPVFRPMAAAGVLSAFIVAPWFARGVITSGCPFYPSQALAVNVDWRVPPEIARNDLQWMRSWARVPAAPPDQVLAGWSWLRPWTRGLFAYEEHVFDVVLPLLIALIAGVALLARPGPKPWRAAACAIPCAAAIVFWFFSAPLPRYAAASLWALAAGLAAAASLARSSGRHGAFGRAAWAAAALVLAAAACHGRDRFIAPGPDRGLYPLPVAAVEPRLTHSGLIVFTPRRGEQCWDAPLPCAPALNPRLRLRQPGCLAAGFTLSSQRDLPALCKDALP